MSLRESIRPGSECRVMDLVAQAGVDTSDWPNYAKGDTAPAANPRYCYEWSFVEPGVVVVLMLWWENMREEAGRVVHTANYRGDAEANRAEHRRPQSQTRGFKLDAALQLALRENLPIRVVVQVGQRFDRDDPDERSSLVKLRRLDEQMWTVSRYDWHTGDCDLVRGYHAAVLLD